MTSFAFGAPGAPPPHEIGGGARVDLPQRRVDAPERAGPGRERGRRHRRPRADVRHRPLSSADWGYRAEEPGVSHPKEEQRGRDGVDARDRRARDEGDDLRRRARAPLARCDGQLEAFDDPVRRVLPVAVIQVAVPRGEKARAVERRRQPLHLGPVPAKDEPEARSVPRERRVDERGEVGGAAVEREPVRVAQGERPAVGGRAAEAVDRHEVAVARAASFEARVRGRDGIDARARASVPVRRSVGAAVADREVGVRDAAFGRGRVRRVGRLRRVERSAVDERRGHAESGNERERRSGASHASNSSASGRGERGGAARRGQLRVARPSPDRSNVGPRYRGRRAVTASTTARARDTVSRASYQRARS